MISIKNFKIKRFKSRKKLHQIDETIGKNTFEKIRELVDINDKNITILCGNSYKGYIGFILARYLRDYGNVFVLFLDKKEKLDDDYKINYFKILGNIKQDTNLIYNSDVLLDCMLDNVVKGFIREPVKSAIIKYNNSKAFKIAIDYPSGLNPDTGMVVDIATKNDMILTIHDIKQGMLDHKNLHIIDAGLD